MSDNDLSQRMKPRKERAISVNQTFITAVPESSVRKKTSILVDPSLHKEALRYALDHDTTLSALIDEGLRLRMGMDQ